MPSCSACSASVLATWGKTCRRTTMRPSVSPSASWCTWSPGRASSLCTWSAEARSPWLHTCSPYSSVSSPSCGATSYPKFILLLWSRKWTRPLISRTAFKCTPWANSEACNNFIWWNEEKEQMMWTTQVEFHFYVHLTAEFVCCTYTNKVVLNWTHLRNFLFTGTPLRSELMLTYTSTFSYPK